MCLWLCNLSSRRTNLHVVPVHSVIITLAWTQNLYIAELSSLSIHIKLVIAKFNNLWNLRKVVDDKEDSPQTV